MQWSIELLSSQAQRVNENLAKVKDVYAQWDIQNHMKDGELSYPRVDDKWETKSTGLELEFW